MNDKELLLLQLTELTTQIGWDIIGLKDNDTGKICGILLGESRTIDVMMGDD